MWRHIAFLVLAVLCGTNGQEDCVPEPVQFLNLHQNGTLTWSLTPGESCNVTSYIVTLQRAFDEEIAYNMETVSQSIYLSFLPSCQLWIFNVLAVSGTSVSRNHFFRGRIPMFPETDLSLDIIHIEQVENSARVEWEFVNRAYESCADAFRVTTVGLFNDLPQDTYTERRFILLPGIAACGQYSFSVRAIHASHGLQEGPLTSAVYDVPAKVQEPPQMVDIHQGTTFVNTTWRIENYFFNNRCTVYSINVDGSPLFNTTFPIDDSEYRPPFQINLSNLQPNTVYQFRVSVLNSVGWSNSATAIVQTLPALEEIVASESKQIKVTLN